MLTWSQWTSHRLHLSGQICYQLYLLYWEMTWTLYNCCCKAGINRNSSVSIVTGYKRDCRNWLPAVPEGFFFASTFRMTGIPNTAHYNGWSSNSTPSYAFVTSAWFILHSLPGVMSAPGMTQECAELWAIKSMKNEHYSIAIRKERHWIIPAHF